MTTPNFQAAQRVSFMFLVEIEETGALTSRSTWLHSPFYGRNMCPQEKPSEHSLTSLGSNGLPGLGEGKAPPLAPSDLSPGRREISTSVPSALPVTAEEE